MIPSFDWFPGGSYRPSAGSVWRESRRTDSNPRPTLTRRLLYQLSYSGATQRTPGLLQDLARPLVGEHLALHALERVVDRLRVAAELARPSPRTTSPRGRGGARPTRAARGRCRGRRRGSAAPRSRSRTPTGRPRSGPGSASPSVHSLSRSWPAGRVAERDVGVERRVLEAGRGLDRGDDLPRHAELGEAAERRLLVGAEVAHRLVEADQPLLDQVLASRRRRGSTSSPSGGRSRVAPHQRVERLASPLRARGRAADPQALVELSAGGAALAVRRSSAPPVSGVPGRRAPQVSPLG